MNGDSAIERPIRIAFHCLVLFGGLLFWIAPRPPMGDLPQHAGQIALLRELIDGSCKWSDIVRINYLTPYLIGIWLTAALSYVFSILTSVKVVLSLAYFGFVAAAVALRKEFDADPRLDFFLPGFFGFSFQYGLYTFLVASPLGLLFLLLARRFARAPSGAAGVRMVVAGIGLFFCHGLVFLYCAAVGFGMAVLGRERNTRARALVPYVVLGLVAVGYSIGVRIYDPVLAHVDAPIEWEWEHSWGWHRIPAFIVYVTASTLKDPLFFPASALMLASPFLLGDRPSADRAAWIPLAGVVFAWVFVPAEAMQTAYLYHRFALFLLPAVAFAFRPARPMPRARALAVQGGLAALCLAFFASVALRERRFAKESAPFETVLAAAEPDQRALSIVFDPYSPASRHPWAYHTFPLWYQAEKGGFVDFNFAYFLPEVVRFRPGHLPPLTGNVEKFDFQALNGSSYRYFFVRHTEPLPPHLFENEQCRIELVREDREWALYERRECTR